MQEIQKTTFADEVIEIDSSDPDQDLELVTFGGSNHSESSEEISLIIIKNKDRSTPKSEETTLRKLKDLILVEESNQPFVCY
jgi:hypothetical protein